MKIYTDHKWKQLKYRTEVPEKVLKAYFDHLTGDDNFDGYISYRKRWYHVSDFMMTGKDSPFPKKWDGYSSDSFFSGILIHLSDDGETYQIATYIS
jgi:hypothetical protein